MKAMVIAAAFVFAVAVIGGAAQAADKPAKADKAEKAEKKPAAAAGDVTLKGEMTCGKCSLKETEKCQNVLKVTEGGKETKYYLVHNDLAKKNHAKVCSSNASATVKGTIADEAGKKVVTASEIKYE